MGKRGFDFLCLFLHVHMLGRRGCTSQAENPMEGELGGIKVALLTYAVCEGPRAMLTSRRAAACDCERTSDGDGGEGEGRSGQMEPASVQAHAFSPVAGADMSTHVSQSLCPLFRSRIPDPARIPRPDDL